MTTEMQTLEQRIADRVAHDLMDLIPQDQWQLLVESQVAKFRTEIAPKIIQGELEKRLRQAMQAELADLKYADMYANFGKDYGAEGLKEIIEKSAPVIFASMFAPVAEGLVQQLRQQLSGY